MLFLRRLTDLLLLLCALTALPVQAEPNHIAARLVAEGGAAAGDTTTLAIVMRPEPGWHGYWRNPGDAGLGMTLGWQVPYGTVPGEPAYPVPQVLLVKGLMNHVYEHDYAVLVPLRLSPDARPGTLVPVRLKADWLACTEEICVPESALLETEVVVGGRSRDPRFDAWRAALPAPLGSPVKFAREGKTIRLGIPMPASVALEEPHIFIGEDRITAYAAPQVFHRKGDMLTVTLQRPGLLPADPATITGVLRLNRAGDGVEFSAAPGPVPTGGKLVSQEAAAPPLALPLLLLAALAGGLLLNVMPCVFPILSLKALSLARAGESEADAHREGLAYAAGVVLACVALGALLLALRAAGEQVGWAFQLQQPGVVVGLLLLAAAITANLAGLFELGLPGFAREGSASGAFATGLLAAFVATPCTGPFMAAAMGAALLLPTVEAMALFVALGLGLALPFLAIAFVPGLRRRLPRPGKWMAWFRKAMALPMALTALALGWLAWRLGGNAYATGAALLTLVLLGTLAAAGHEQRMGRSARGALLVCLALLIAAPAVLPRPSPRAATNTSILPSQPFSPAALDKARASGKPVFVYFTADWCLTCKVNEAAAIERAEVKAAFDKAGVTVLIGDWTRRDPAITRFLISHGAAGVPLYLWYAPGGEAEQLPQVLTSGMLVERARG